MEQPPQTSPTNRAGLSVFDTLPDFVSSGASFYCQAASALQGALEELDGRDRNEAKRPAALRIAQAAMEDIVIMRPLFDFAVGIGPLPDRVYLWERYQEFVQSFDECDRPTGHEMMEEVDTLVERFTR